MYETRLVPYETRLVAVTGSRLASVFSAPLLNSATAEINCQRVKAKETVMAGQETVVHIGENSRKIASVSAWWVPDEGRGR